MGTALGPDADPGDGVCATADGGCSLEAAIDEANTVPRARIVVNGQHPELDAVVTRNLEMRGSTWFADAGDTRLHVAEGALSLRDMAIGALGVDGSVIADRVGFGFNQGGPPGVPNIAVGPTGVMVGAPKSVLGVIQDGVRNEGRLVLRYTTLYSEAEGPGAAEAMLITTGAGTTSLGASVFLGWLAGDMVDACAGTPPVSEGWNPAPTRRAGSADRMTRKRSTCSGRTMSCTRPSSTTEAPQGQRSVPRRRPPADRRRGRSRLIDARPLTPGSG